MNTGKTTNPVVIILIIVLGFIVGIFYYYSTKQEAIEETAPLTIHDPEYLKFKDLTFDVRFFKEKLFASLKKIGEFPIPPGPTGKQNLFAP